MLVDLERISDYAVNVEKQAIIAKDLNLSTKDKDLIKTLKKNIKTMENNILDEKAAEALNHEYHKLRHSLRKEQIQDIKDHKTNSEIGMMFSRILTYFGRIKDHAINIAQEPHKINN